MTKKKVMLTQEGKNKLIEKLEYLKSVKRLEIADRLRAAIALGDLSENSEYTDAKNEQAFLEGEISDLENKIHNSEIIQDDGGDVVSIGSKVKILDVEFGEEEIYTIVGSTEADPDENKISSSRTCRSFAVQDFGNCKIRLKGGKMERWKVKIKLNNLMKMNLSKFVTKS